MKFSAREDIIQLTPLWKGERFEDGRPKVPQSVINRIRNITIEEAWGPMWKDHNYKCQFVTGFEISNPGLKLCGRAVTTTFVPSRPDLNETLINYGHEKEGRKGMYNQWVIDTLVEDDVIVCDLFDKIFQGTYIGGNLATAIATRTKRGGLVCWGGIRDLEQIAEIENLQVYHRGEDPTAIAECVMTGFNGITRIGGATCLPGDIVLATMSGVIFIPAHLAEEIADNAEKSQVRDIWGFEVLASGEYSGAQIDSMWTLDMFNVFQNWMQKSEKAAPYRHLTWDAEIEQIKKWWEENPTGKPNVVI